MVTCSIPQHANVTLVQKNMKKALTVMSVDRLRPPPSGRLEIGDGTVPGLCLRVTDNGVKSWQLIYRVIPKTRFLPSRSTKTTFYETSTNSQGHTGVGILRAKNSFNELRQMVVDCKLRSTAANGLQLVGVKQIR